MTGWRLPGVAGLLHRPLKFCTVATAENFRNHRPPGDSEGAAKAYSQRVAKLKPTAMNPMPTIRLYWPRSLNSGTWEMSLLKT